jgi:hypothetical protein
VGEPAGAFTKEQSMSSRTLKIIALGVVAVLVAAAIGGAAYNAGLARGVAESSRVLAAPGSGPTVVVPYVHGHGWHGGFGFFPVFPFFGLLFLFFALKFLFWRGPWGPWSRGGYWMNGVPPAFEEWHRRAHGQTPVQPPSPGATT